MSLSSIYLGNRGFRVDYPLYKAFDPRNKRPEAVEEAFMNLYNEVAKEKSSKPQLVMVIVPFKNAPVYALVKHLADVKLGMPSQFVLAKNVRGKQNRPDLATVNNILLKLNSKLCGKNQALHKPPMTFFQRPIMFVGADVTHPSPDDMGTKPSVAAMVASLDPQVSLYSCEVRFQYSGQVVEVIEDTENMMKKLLLAFYSKNNSRKPEKIIFYRDGVSEGQFQDVLNREVSAIRRACTSLEADYKPGITFMIAQKRHKTRLFPADAKDGVGKMGNVPPGTVVDTIITNPTEESFFLVSHEGIQVSESTFSRASTEFLSIQGTSRPTGYHKLWDDNQLDANTIQKLTYFLCHLYARCQRSVSYPAPTYYAHLAAFRARVHHDHLISLEKDQRNGKEIKELEHPKLLDYFI